MWNVKNAHEQESPGRKQRQSDKIRGKSDLCVDNKIVFAYTDC